MIAFFLFFPMCLIVGADVDCSFEWTVIDDRQTFEDTYNLYTTSNLDAERIGAFTIDSERRIFYYNADVGTIVHEAKHALCILNNEDLAERNYCHAQVDIDDIAEKSTRPYHECPIITCNSPPEFSAKMAYHNMIYSAHLR